MKQGKHKIEKVKIIDRYLVLILIAILALGIAYAQIANQELTVSGNAETEVQEGVFISKIEYKSNVGADTTNSGINYYLGTMMDSKVTLGSSSTSTISYDVTVYNNTDKEQLFIKTLTDDTDEILYSNKNIGYSVSLEDYITTIAPKQSLTFTITFAYEGTDISNPVLESKLNFRFREKPVIELSNEGTTYELENIYAGAEKEYEFTVKNNNATYTNGVPMKYTFETTLTEGSSLTAEIYDASGSKVTGAVTLTSDGTKVENKYKLKLTWDSSKTSTEYEGKEYSCKVALKATPTEAKYLDYEIEKNFNVNITTNTTPSITATVSNITEKGATITANGTDSDGDTLQYTLLINGEVASGPSTTNTWTLSNLNSNTTYTYVVNVTDGKSEAETQSQTFTTLIANKAPTVTASVSNITTTGATITAVGADADGDTIQYTLVVNGQTYGPNTTKEWNVTGLSGATTYDYTVTVTDGKDTTSTTGTFTTWCSGGTSSCTATLCTINKETVTSNCTTCSGNGLICNLCGSWRKIARNGGGRDSDETCFKCGLAYGTDEGIAWPIECATCLNENGKYYTVWVRYCNTCAEKYMGDSSVYTEPVPTFFASGVNLPTYFKVCTSCKGAMTTTSTSYASTCSTHDMSGKHYYCTTHDYVGTSQSCSIACTHGLITEHPTDINCVGYIESTGTQYINTGIKPDSNTDFELAFSASDFATTQGLMGSRVAQKDSAYNIFLYKGSLRWDYYTSQTSSSLTYSAGSIVKISKSGSETVFETNGSTQTVTDSTTSFSNTYDMYIFNLNTAGTLYGTPASMKLYYFKIYKNDELVRNFVPALDGSNIACLYDIVSGKYFYNSGSGTFNYP